MTGHTRTRTRTHKNYITTYDVIIFPHLMYIPYIDIRNEIQMKSIQQENT